MSKPAFIANFLELKGNQALNSALSLLVSWDPKGTSEADIMTMEEDLDKLGVKVSEARQSFKKEKAEADAILALQKKRLAAAEHNEKLFNAEVDPIKKAGLGKSLASQLDQLEKMVPEVEKEVAEADEAEEFLTMLENAYKQFGDKLKSARADLEAAQNNMKRAAFQKDQAEIRANAAKEAAGLINATSTISVALNAMQEKTAKIQAETEALNMKAALLRPTNIEEDDPNIAAAMAAVSGEETKPMSLSERLAALKQGR